MKSQLTQFSFGSRTEREDADFVGRVISFSALGKIWTLAVEEARTTRYNRRPNERYLRASLLLGANPPANDLSGELLPDHTAARVTCTNRGRDGAWEVVLAVSLLADAGTLEHAA
jgi:hypothetical protein